MVSWPIVVALVALERVAELVVARRNAAWSFARGGRELGREHYPFMVALHSGLLLACVLEPWLFGRVAPPWLSALCLAVCVASQALRWWCIRSLGLRWNTRVIVVDEPLVVAGPYRWMRHPNYLAVVLEGLALPLGGGAWISAAVFTVLNAWLLRVRIRVEEQALAGLGGAR